MSLLLTRGLFPGVNAMDSDTIFGLPQLLDLMTFAASALLYAGYVLFLRMKTRSNPAYTIQGITIIARTAWVRKVMEEKMDILAVQTLRNSTMAATFLASTAILLTVGVLTLTGQGDKLGVTWHSLNLLGSKHESVLAIKLVALLMDLFTAFFCFSTSVRQFNHVGYMINAPYGETKKVMSPGIVAAQLNRGGYYYSAGMRALYCMVPLIFWIFGPVFLIASTCVMLVILFRLDRTPAELETEYLSQCSID